MYFEHVSQFAKMLKNLSGFLDKAEAHATAKKFEVGNLLEARLAPDMYEFISQVQMSCDTAKGYAARLTGKENPKHEDNETTLPEVRARIAKTIAFLETIKAEDFKGVETKRVTVPWKEGKYIAGDQYALEMSIPNFYFHVTTAYLILRNNGVDVGKTDFLGSLPYKDL